MELVCTSCKRISSSDGGKTNFDAMAWRGRHDVSTRRAKRTTTKRQIGPPEIVAHRTLALTRFEKKTRLRGDTFASRRASGTLETAFFRFSTPRMAFGTIRFAPGSRKSRDAESAFQRRFR